MVHRCVSCVAMNIETVPNRNSPPCILLRESYREGGKVKKRTIANLSKWSSELVENFRALLRGGGQLLNIWKKVLMWCDPVPMAM